MIKIWSLLLLLVVASSYSPASVAAQLDSSGGTPQETISRDLPLKVLATPIESSLPMCVYISGDGGWNSFNASFCQYLTQKGIPVIELDSQKYFWKFRTPDETTRDLIAVIEQYGKLWKRDRFVLAGYSFGSTVVPFVLNRLPAGIKVRLAAAVLISPDKTSDFEIHLSDMLNLGISKGKYDVLREIQSGDYKKYVAVFGSDESAETQQAFKQAGAKIEVLQGNHHFDSAYDALANLIIAEIK
jgi:type IV secretory pathway VirJ component